MPIKEQCRKWGFSHATFDKWRDKFGGTDVSEGGRLTQLEGKYAKLKKLPADAHLDIHALKSVFGLPLDSTGTSDRCNHLHGGGK